MSVLNNVIKCVTASSEEDLYPILEALTEPAETKSLMGERLNNLLGYNPLTVHDCKALKDLLERALDSADESIKADMLVNEDEIIVEALAEVEEMNEEVLSKALAKVLEYRYSWSPEYLADSISFDVDDNDEDYDEASDSDCEEEED